MLIQANNIILDELLRLEAHPHLHPFSVHRLGIDRQGGEGAAVLAESWVEAHTNTLKK